MDPTPPPSMLMHVFKEPFTYVLIIITANVHFLFCGQKSIVLLFQTLKFTSIFDLPIQYIGAEESVGKMHKKYYKRLDTLRSLYIVSFALNHFLKFSFQSYFFCYWNLQLSLHMSRFSGANIFRNLMQITSRKANNESAFVRRKD